MAKNQTQIKVLWLSLLLARMKKIQSENEGVRVICHSVTILPILYIIIIKINK